MPLSHSAVMHFLTNKELMSGFGHERRTVWSKRKVSKVYVGNCNISPARRSRKRRARKNNFT